MAVPALPTALNAGDVVSNAWVDAVRDGLEFQRDTRPVFKGQAMNGDAPAGSDADLDVNDDTNTTFGFGRDSAFERTPITNVGGWATATADANPESLVVPEGGIYLVTTHSQFEANAVGYRQMQMRVGGSAQAASLAKINALSGGVTTLTQTFFLDASASDEWDLSIYQTGNAGSLSVTVFLSAIWMQST
jgi:hypothetical protein